MLSPAIVREIERLLEEGQHTHRKIATTVGVSRSTVAAVASGERRINIAFHRAPKPRPPGKVQRCSSCGAKVRMPCLLCQIREVASGEQLPPAMSLEIPIGLNLKPEHQARYAEVRRWRREALRLAAITAPQSDSDVTSSSS